MHAAEFQQIPMHPCAAGPDTLQGNASESWWIAHSMMHKCMQSMMKMQFVDISQNTMQAEIQQIPMHPRAKGPDKMQGVASEPW